MVYGMENNLTTPVREAQAPTQSQQNARDLTGKRPSRFDFQQSTGWLVIRQTAGYN